MRFRRIEIRDYRKLKRLVLPHLPDGMTVICGDNEEGKSTLLQALRAALFVRHDSKSSLVQSFLPYASDVRPEIRIDLEREGQMYSLVKSFWQKGSVELRGPNRQHLTGSVAEEELAKLLGVNPPVKASLDPEYQGTCGFLWLSQGDSYLPHQPTEAVIRDVHAALDEEAEVLLTGKVSRSLRAQYQEEVGQFFTKKRGKPRDELREAEENVAKLTETRRLLLDSRREHDTWVDELGRVRDDLRRLNEDEQLAARQADLLTAEKRLVWLTAIEQELAKKRQTLDILKQRLEQQRERVEQRAKLREELAQADQELTSLGVLVLQQRTAFEQGKQDFQQIEERRNTQEQIVRKAEQEKQSVRKQVEKAGCLLKRKQIDSQLAEVERLLVQKMEVNAALDRCAVGEKELGVLRELDKVVLEKQIALEAVATTLFFEGIPADGVCVNGEKVTTVTVEQLVIDRTEITFGNGCKLIVTPGRTSAAKLRNDLLVSRQKFADALFHFGVKDLAGAQEEAEQRAKLLLERAEIEKQIAILSPHEGPSLAERRSILVRQMELLAEVEWPTKKMEELETLLLEKEDTLRKLQLERTRCENMARVAAGQLEDLRAELAQSNGRREQEQKHVDSLKARLVREVMHADDDALAQIQDEIQKAVIKQKTEVDSLAWDIAETEPERLRLRVEQGRAMVQRLGEERNRLKTKEEELVAVLQSHGHRVLTEELEQTEKKLVFAKAEYDQLQRKAKALNLLFTSLDTQTRLSKEKYLDPLVNLCESYFAAMFLSTEVAFDQETLRILSLKRKEIDEPLPSLSIGTREQIAVCLRLAMADLWATRGQAPPIVLDDALTHSDDSRLERMLGILRQAGKRHQIIVLTCHERAFLPSGAKLLRLSEHLSAA